MAAKKAPPQQSKSAFIRAQPATMSAADVVSQGKAAGITLRPELVYEVRRVARARTASGATASGSRGASGATASGATASRGKGNAKRSKSRSAKGAGARSSLGKGKALSKADFVRAHANASPREITEKAAAEGITLGTRYVYNVRGSDRAAAKKKRQQARSGAPRKGVAVPRPIATTSRAEDLLKAVGAEVGLAKAIEILSGERARVKAVLGG
jgi:hypothetical protein